jgi:hypothetical protein
MKTESPYSKEWGFFFVRRIFREEGILNFVWHRITRGTEDGLRMLIGTDGVDNCITYTTPANQNSGWRLV